MTHGSIPWVSRERELAILQQHAERGDGAALVEAVRHCQQYGAPVPPWVVTNLEEWLAEFLVLTTPPKLRPRVLRPRFTAWARTYLRAFRDWMIAHHLEDTLRVYGLTHAEALDEAAIYFRGTPLEDQPATLAKAWQRARRRGGDGWFQRMLTGFENRVLVRQLTPIIQAGSPRHFWSVLNADRQGGRRGDWRERPRLLSDLSPAELERAALAVCASWRKDARVRKKPTPKRHDT